MSHSPAGVVAAPDAFVGLGLSAKRCFSLVATMDCTSARVTCSDLSGPQASCDAVSSGVHTEGFVVTARGITPARATPTTATETHHLVKRGKTLAVQLDARIRSLVP